jgi:hypothetical protein
MDMRKFNTGALRPVDLYDGPRVEKIVNVSESSKHDCAVLEFADGSQLFLWNNLARVLSRAWGYNSDDYLGQEVELSLDHYLDRKSDPPTEKECIAIRAVSSPKAATGNGGVPAPAAARKDSMNDDVPF